MNSSSLFHCRADGKRWAEWAFTIDIQPRYAECTKEGADGGNVLLCCLFVTGEILYSTRRASDKEVWLSPYTVVPNS
jgi:hypothetical protein